MELFNYFRSSASFRVRIALALKGLDYRYTSVHLPRREHLNESYAAVSASRLVPTLREDDGHLLTQSLAIIEYLEETHPDPALMPQDARGRARVRALAYDIACEIHPLNNLRVLRYLTADLGLGEDDKNRWYRHWCEQGLAAIEQVLANDARVGRYCYGDTPSLADCFLVPQVANAQRMHCDLSAMPTVQRINDACLQLPAFIAASPAQQPDAE